jgi:lysophospholipase L1-like esterase
LLAEYAGAWQVSSAMPTESPRTTTSRRARVMLVLFGIITGLAVVEGVLHLVTPALDYHFPSSRIMDERFTQRASTVIVGGGIRYAYDADGFRTSSATPVGDRTVLFIGDSFTQGLGVNQNETFPAITCDRLLREGIRARCLNAGVSGFGTAHELRLLRTILQRAGLHVDAVVFQVLPSNDLRDNWEDGGFGLDGERLTVLAPPRIPIAVRLRDALLDNAFARGSRILTLAANAWFRGEGMDLHDDAAAFELERRLLQEVVATTQQRGIPMVIAVCATAWEVNQTTSQPYDARARLDFVAAAVQTLHVPWIDSRDVARAPEHYIPNDGHFSAAGNAVMGELLAARLAPLLRR